MVTREEKLKKITDELEQLSDEELDGVAGGTMRETAGDSQILYNHGLMDDHYGSIPVMFSWNSKSAEVDAGWAKSGITCVTVPMDANKYFVGDKEISRREAFDIVKSKFKRLSD